MQRLHGRDDAQAEVDAKGLLGLRGVKGQGRDGGGSRRAGQEGGTEGAQVPRADCDRRVGPRVRLVANTLGR